MVRSLFLERRVRGSDRNCCSLRDIILLFASLASAVTGSDILFGLNFSGVYRIKVIR